MLEGSVVKSALCGDLTDETLREGGRRTERLLLAGISIRWCAAVCSCLPNLFLLLLLLLRKHLGFDVCANQRTACRLRGRRTCTERQSPRSPSPG